MDWRELSQGLLFKNTFRASVLFLLAVILSPVWGVNALEFRPPVFIAHAGGAVNGETYTNSLEALEANYAKGFRFFEMDFSWTSDNELVAIHNWEGALRGKFIVPPDMEIPTREEFLALEMKRGLKQLDFESALEWASTKGDAYVVSDIKTANIVALTKINRDFRAFKKHLIPQVYSFEEFDAARLLGYHQIILTLYRMKTTPYDVALFAYERTPLAITMPWEVAQSGLALYLQKNKTIVYAHTVNEENLFSSLRKIGVYGVYTDYLSPHDDRDPMN